MSTQSFPHSSQIAIPGVCPATMPPTWLRVFLQKEHWSVTAARSRDPGAENDFQPPDEADTGEAYPRR